ncbi:MAG: type IV pilus secretin PilQ [Deltaproteobacteria bacterium]|nr:type IV pilus secretin PilQ [Deltaproteobacteria bacterium]
MTDDRLRHGLIGSILAGALIFTGCASTGPKDIKTDGAPEAAVAAPQAQNEAAPDVISVEYINMVGDGDRVMIATTGPVKFTAFRLSDPARLILDLPGVNLDKVPAALAVNNAFVGEITSATYGEGKDIGRVVIGLKEGIDHDVKSGDNSILVSLSRPAAAAVAPATEPAKAEAQTAATPEPVKVEDLAPKAKSMKQASTVVKVVESKDGENTVIRIMSDGLLGNYSTFDLDSPGRVVIDVWDVGSSIGKDVVRLEGKYLKTVRIGTHADKARFVFDAAGKKLTPHSIKRVEDEIVLTIGPKVVPAVDEAAKPARKLVKKAEPVKTAKAEKKAEPKAEAPIAESQKAAPATVTAEAEIAAPAPKAAEAPKAEPEKAVKADNGIKVEKVDFRRSNGAGSLSIATSARAEYNVKESADGRTVTIDIKGATIPDELTRTLDAAKLNTAVATISSFQGSFEPKEVRVIVKLKEKAPYTVTDEDGTLKLEFAAVVAEPAPAIKAEAEPQAGEKGANKEDAIVAEKREYTGARIDLDMMDANVSDVLRLLAEISNMNIIASDDVKGTISLRLKNVPWDQAFDIILRSKELDSVQEGNVIRVAPAMKIRLEKESFLASRKAQEKLENLEIHFIPVNYASSVELIKQVQGVLTDRGTVTNDARTNTIIVKDIRTGVEAAKNLITKLDTAIPQVLIEARIVEASTSFARDLGIQWGLEYGTGGNTSTETFGASGTEGQAVQTFQTPNSNITATGADQYAVNLPATGSAGTLGALGFLLGKAGSNPFLLDLRLSAGETEGRLKTISRPRITTMDNKEAKIEQGESIPFETTSSAGTATTFIDANLSLTVTPHITPDGSVLMKIKASRNSIGTFRTSGGEPSINKKESSTEVLVRDGETTVIGGIVITDKNDSDKGIPYLQDIPVIGWLFKSKSVSDSQTELLIFITPTILKDKIKA